MRILFIGAHFPRPNNPTNGTWALSQVQALAAAGHDVQVISPIPAIPSWLSRMLKQGTSAECPSSHRWGRVNAQYVRWLVFPVGPISRWLQDYPNRFVPPAYALAAHRFRRIARAFKPDIIFAHHALMGGYIASRLAGELSVPYVVTEHDFEEIDSLLTHAARRQYYGRVTRAAATWVAVANRMRDGMRRVFPDVPSLTVHNGATTLNSLRKLARPSQLENRVVVLCVCFMYRRKNVPLLIRAFDAACAAYSNAQLVVIGDGEDKADVRATAASARHPGQISILDSKPHEEVLNWMSWCDVFANVGADEPFATVFTEAMMHGKPIVYAADGGITDVVKSGTHGVAVQPNDEVSAAMALEMLIADAGTRERMGDAALALSRTLSWSVNAARMTRLFEDAIDEQYQSTAAS